MGVSKLKSSWAIRSLAANAIGCAVDYTVLFTSETALGFPTRLSLALGLVAGLSTSFALNRRYAFRDSAATGGWAVLRYALAMSVLILIHINVGHFLRHGLELPLWAAKVLADSGVMAGGQLLVLRYLVFPRNKSAARTAPNDRAPGLA